MTVFLFLVIPDISILRGNLESSGKSIVQLTCDILNKYVDPGSRRNLSFHRMLQLNMLCNDRDKD